MMPSQVQDWSGGGGLPSAILFGPQVTQWTPEAIRDLQQRLQQDPRLRFVADTLAQLPRTSQPLLHKLLGPDAPALDHLVLLANLATGDAASLPNASDFTTVHLAALTVVSHVADFVRLVGEQGPQNPEMLLPGGITAVQGFCIGFLTAAAAASSATWAEFEASACRALHLAVCIGAIVDAAEKRDSQGQGSGYASHSVRWKTDADRASLEALVDALPGAYISCTTDERTVTVTLPTAEENAFYSRIAGAAGGIVAKPIGLRGCFHHDTKHGAAARALKDLCSAADTPELHLPAADRLRLPLRSTADGEILRHGALHDAAIDAILTRRAHWFQTVRRTLSEDLPSGAEIKCVPIDGASSTVPRSLRSGGVSKTGARHDAAKDEEIAIIGMACRFPRADSLHDFWELLRTGGTALSRVPSARFDRDQVAREPRIDYWGNFLAHPDVFDHRFFGISGREAKSMDPQQRLALQVAYEALGSAGYFSALRGSGSSPGKRHANDVGCYLGVGSVDYEDNVASEKANAFSATGTLRAFISGRISHHFGWSGPSVTVDTACSSSAVAIHTACQAILAGECSMALAGGVNVITSPTLYQNLAAASFLSPTGSSKAFDASADGYCRGEGCGILVLKPLSRAIADGDDILGVISGTAVNQGANCSPITVPHSESQKALYTKALEIGGIDPAEVTYVEAHGTGTPVGDPIEFESVRSTFSRPGRSADLFLGSVKDNIGHTEGASGVAGVIKAVLMLRHKTIPRQANFHTLSPRITVAPEDRIIVPTSTRPWTAAGRRVALVNNYGAAGSNAAIVVREHTLPVELAPAKERCHYPILLSAKSPRSLRAYAAALRTRIKAAAAEANAREGALGMIGDIAYSVAVTRNPALEYRAAVQAEAVDELLSKLDEIAAADDDAASLLRQVPPRRPAVLCFGGQTGRPVTLSKTLFDSCSILRAYLNECHDVCKALGLPSLFPAIFQEREAAAQDLVAEHCMLFSLQYASAKCWLDSGLEVDTLIGHSFGQLTALCVAEAVSLRDALRLIAGRARLIQERWGQERGVMLAVEGDMQEIQAVVESFNRKQDSGVGVDFACYNGPGSVVLAGDASSIDRVEQLFRGQRSDETARRFKTARLKNSHAYHSRFADSILAGLEELAQSVAFKKPLIRIETCSPGESWNRIGPHEIVGHTRQPVYFHDAVQRILARLPGGAIWVEAGSSSAIIPMTQRILSARPDAPNDVLIPLDLGVHDRAGHSLVSAAGQLWMAGSTAEPWQFHMSQRRTTKSYSRVDLPPYQFEQSSHWIRTTASTRGSSSAGKDNTDLPTKESSNLVTLVNKNDGSQTGEVLFLVDTAHPVFDQATRGHAVVGQSLCPASMYIEIAARCAAKLSSGGEGAGLVLPHVEDLVMSSPLGLATTSDMDVYVRLSRRDADTSSLYDFSVFSRQTPTAEENSEEQQHARGRIRLCAAEDPAAAARMALLKRVARGVPSSRIANAPGSTSISGPLVYKVFGDVVEYAPYYRGVRSLAGCEHEAIGSVTLPADRLIASGLEPGVCDPVLLDNFLQVAGIHVNCLSERKPAEVFMCTAVEDVVFSQPFLENRSLARSWQVYSRYETVSKGEVVNDIFVFDSTSTQLAMAIMGATFKNVPLKSLARSLARLNSNSGTARSSDSGYASPNVPAEDQVELGSHSPPSSTAAHTPKQSSNASTAPTRTKPAQQSQTHEKIRKMFSEIIEIPVAEVRPSSTFDELGIDSLLVTEVLSEIRKRFGVAMTPGEFQECRDVLGLCRRIEPGGSSSSEEEGSDDSQATAAPRLSLNSSDTKTASVDESNGLNGGFGGGATSVDGHGDERDSGSFGGNFVLVSQEAFAKVKGGYDEHARTTGFAGFCDGAYALQSKLVVRYVADAFAALGCDLATLRAGDPVPTIRHVPQHSKLVPQLYRILEDGGLVVAAAAEGTNGGFRRTGVAVPTTTASQLHADMLARYPQHEAETKLLHTTGPRLAECLTGTADPLALIFRDASARALLEEVYTNAPMFKAGTMLLADYLCSVVDAMEKGREVRILELGAGTGGTTKHLVTRLAERNRRFSYTFTDLSPSLVAAAKRKFSGRHYMRYAVLDVEKEPPPSEVGAYDVVVSTNCIHATRDLVSSTSHIRRMLRPDGVLCLVELTRNLFWFDLVFGLLEGWWLFEDGRSHALADEWRWQRCLRAAGFQWVDWSEGPSRESAVLRVIAASPMPAASEPASKDSFGRQSQEAETTDEGYEREKKWQGKQAEADQNGTPNPRLLSKETVVFKKLAGADGLQLEADIYYPAHEVDPANPLPIALMIHGGGHIMLSRGDIRPQQTDMLLRLGFLPVSIDYRLCPEVTLPEGPMTDVADALAWARNELPTLQLQRRDVRPDGNRVVAVGWSTGGTLAMSLAWKPPAEQRGVRPVEGVLAFYCPTDYEDDFWTQPNRPAGSVAAAARYANYQLDDATWTAGVFDQPITRYNVAADVGKGNKKRPVVGGWLAPDDARSRVALYMNWHGRSLNVLLHGLDKRTRVEPPPPTADMVRAVSPLAHVRVGEHASPVFIVHPRADDLIPWQQAARTYEALRERKIRAGLRLVGGGAPHLFDVYRGWESNEEARVAVQDGYAFLCECVGLEGRSRLELLS